MVVEGREAMRDLVAEGFGIGFAAEAEIVADSRLDKISISSDSLKCGNAGLPQSVGIACNQGFF